MGKRRPRSQGHKCLRSHRRKSSCNLAPRTARCTLDARERSGRSEKRGPWGCLPAVEAWGDLLSCCLAWVFTRGKSRSPGPLPGQLPCCCHRSDASEPLREVLASALARTLKAPLRTWLLPKRKQPAGATKCLLSRSQFSPHRSISWLEPKEEAVREL